MISHDICYSTRLTRYGGHGYRHIFANVIPLMRRRGYQRGRDRRHHGPHTEAFADVCLERDEFGL